MCLHGLLLRHGVEDRTVLCLGHRTWATFTWPLKELRDNVWVLNQSADVGASFIFTYNPDEWQAVWPNVFLEEGVGITLTPQGCFEQLPMAALRASTKMTFEHLSIIGKCLGINKAQSLPRRDLIGRCCDIVSESIDGSFREFILDLEDQHASKRKLAVSNPELAQHFLDGLDKDELDDFKDIKKSICPKSMLKRKWHELQEKAKQDLADTCCGTSLFTCVLCFLISVCVCLRLSPHLAFLVACHHCSGKRSSKKEKSSCQSFCQSQREGTWQRKRPKTRQRARSWQRKRQVKKCTSACTSSRLRS